MDSPDPILFFWEKFSQVDSKGRRVIRFKDRAELDLLYQTGFVDSEQYGADDWREAFKDSLQADGGYVVNEKQWSEKRKYVDQRPVADPFDPLQIREGEWSQRDFEAMLEEKVLPEMLLNAEIFRKHMEPIHAQMAAGTRLTIGAGFKRALKDVLDQYPSPRRLRGMAFAAVKKAAATSPASTAFARGPSASSSAMDQLSKLLKK